MLGEAGFTRLAGINHANAARLAQLLGDIPGVEILSEGFFNEFTVRLAKPAAALVDRLAERGVLAGVPVSRLIPGDAALENLLLVAATELTGEDDMQSLAEALREELQ